jgi:hypothetical protein
MAKEKYANFKSFWPFYLSEHQHPLNRRLHFIGTGLALLALLGFGITRKKRFLFLAPLLGYGFAWVGHFKVEKNRPATFQYPFKSLRGDLQLFGVMGQAYLNKIRQVIQ